MIPWPINFYGLTLGFFKTLLAIIWNGILTYLIFTGHLEKKVSPLELLIRGESKPINWHWWTKPSKSKLFNQFFKKCSKPKIELNRKNRQKSTSPSIFGRFLKCQKIIKPKPNHFTYLWFEMSFNYVLNFLSKVLRET